MSGKKKNTAAFKKAEKEKAKKFKDLQERIFKFCHEQNLHIICTDMMNKAFLNHEANPSMSTTLFMANYLLQEHNDISIEQHCANEVTSLSKLVDEYKAQRQRDVYKLEYYENTIEAMKRQGYGQFQTAYREPMVRIPSKVLFINSENTAEHMPSTSSLSHGKPVINVSSIQALKEEVLTPTSEIPTPQFDTLPLSDDLKEELQLSEPDETSTSDSTSNSEDEKLKPLTDASGNFVEITVNTNVSPAANFEPPIIDENVKTVNEDRKEQVIKDLEASDRKDEPKQLKIALKVVTECKMPADAKRFDVYGNENTENEQFPVVNRSGQTSDVSTPINEEAFKILPPPFNSESAEKVDSSYSTIHYDNITDLVKDFTWDGPEEETETLVIDEAVNSTVDTEIRSAIENLIDFDSNLDMDELFDGPKNCPEPSGSDFDQQKPRVMDSIELQLMNLVTSPVKPSEAPFGIVEAQNEVESNHEFLPDGESNAETPEQMRTSDQAPVQLLSDEKTMKVSPMKSLATQKPVDQKVQSNVQTSMPLLDQTLKNVSAPKATFDIAEMETNFEPDYEEDD